LRPAAGTSADTPKAGPQQAASSAAPLLGHAERSGRRKRAQDQAMLAGGRYSTQHSCYPLLSLEAIMMTAGCFLVPCVL
jgi:hypothetical protein